MILEKCLCKATPVIHDSWTMDACWVTCEVCHISTIRNFSCSGCKERQILIWNEMIKQMKKDEYKDNLVSGKYAVNWKTGRIE
jgi:hypothetical protein